MPVSRTAAIVGLASALVALVALIAASSASAAFPGANGKIAFSQGGQVKVVNPDGSGETAVRPGTSPAWSADGRDIAFDFGSDPNSSGIWRMPADGSSATRVWENTEWMGRGQWAGHPAWSPDGTRIVAEYFVCPDDTCQDYVLTFNADGAQFGSNPGGITGGESIPSWSPDGKRIAFYARPDGGNYLDLYGIYTVWPDGSHREYVYTGQRPGWGDPLYIEHIDWSPDGSKMVFSVREQDFGGDVTCGSAQPQSCYDIYVVPSTGGSAGSIGTRLTNNGAVDDRGPVWSPDGTQIAFTSNRDGDNEIYRMNPDGSDVTRVTDNTVSDTTPDWEPIPVNSYARPKGATPVRVPLVVGFPECTTPNAVHGPPLEHPSCGDNQNPHPTSSQHLTVGTPDTNGAPANFVGFLRIGVQVGNPATPADEADLRLMVSTTDVRCRPVAAPTTCGTSNVVGADFVGELQARVALRITDKDNTPTPSGPGAATTVDMPYSFKIPCTETPDNMIGSACEVDTTADALIPGTIKEGARAIWELGQVEVLDGGPDGDVDTPAGAMVFLRQGILVP